MAGGATLQYGIVEARVLVREAEREDHDRRRDVGGERHRERMPAPGLRAEALRDRDEAGDHVGEPDDAEGLLHGALPTRAANDSRIPPSRRARVLARAARVAPGQRERHARELAEAREHAGLHVRALERRRLGGTRDAAEIGEPVLAGFEQAFEQAQRFVVAERRREERRSAPGSARDTLRTSRRRRRCATPRRIQGTSTGACEISTSVAPTSYSGSASFMCRSVQSTTPVTRPSRASTLRGWKSP